jgi:hypothetical protein
MSEELSISDLNAFYEAAEAADKEIFSEMRSNILLIAGEHYARKNKIYQNRVRESESLTETQKLRLTKNHIYKAFRYYTSAILSTVPGVSVGPHNESEMQDQKSADLNHSVWEDTKHRHRQNEKFRQMADDFCGIGEVCWQISYDYSKGKLQGYEGAIDPETEEPVLDEMGQQVPDMDRPVFSGDFVFTRHFGFNVFRSSQAQSMEDSPFIGVRKMVDPKELRKKYKGDKKKLSMIDGASGEEFVVFDSNRAAYEKTNKQILVKEFYFKPSLTYPQGYFYIATSAGILEEGELPGGIFPIIWTGFDEHPTAARGRSFIKQARPYQAEINRAASQMATTQITIGDDKILYQAGTKLQSGALLPGVRGLTFQGALPTVLPGRDGSQFLDYINSNISEMYQVLMIEEALMDDDKNANFDVYALLYRSMAQEKKFKPYIEKFSQFIVDYVFLYLEMAKFYLPDDALIAAIGRDEMVNIAEFRAAENIRNQIIILPQSDTIETKLGKQLTMNQILQYSGQSLDKEHLGKLIRNMPYGNTEEIFDDLTIDYDNVKNEMLALERGEIPPYSQYEDHEYATKRFVHRMKKADFKFLPPEIQQAYFQRYKEHVGIIEEQMAAIEAAKNEQIPTGGALIAADMYVPNKEDPTKLPKRVRLPYQALEWLVETLETQGASLDKLEAQDKVTLAEAVKSLPQEANPQSLQDLNFNGGQQGAVA